ncbi:MAG TPA: hypothetical protein VIC57_05370, partial [Candidatus Dormibacteraeota bacterium]
HTGRARVALAEMTKDSDVAIDVRRLAERPRLEDAMDAGGFHQNPAAGPPGAWMSRDGIPVDLMVPDALVSDVGRRGARIPPHSSRATRRAIGLEAAVVDHSPVTVRGLSPRDGRALVANVASPAALLVAKLHKLDERRSSPRRLVKKDAHDVYRLLVACATRDLSDSLRRLRDDELSARVTELALASLGELFAAGPHALGCSMAGQAEDGIGDPDVVAAAAAALADDLVRDTRRD